MKYYYLGKETSWGRNIHPIPAGPFKAVRMKEERTGKMVFLPIVQSKWEKERNEFWYYGFGHIKLNNRKTYEIPLFSGNAEDWNEYKEKYGKYCLYYSINGKAFSFDCADLCEIYEFNSICGSDVMKYPAFVDCFFRMNEIQERVIAEKFNGVTLIKNERERMIFRPGHSIMGFAFPYLADVLADDKKLEIFWRSYRAKDLPFSERHSKAFEERIDAEINTENDVFPTCMSDRIKLIYGNECEALYSRALELSA